MLKSFTAFKKETDLDPEDINKIFFKVTNVGYAQLNNIEQFITKSPNTKFNIYLYIYIKHGHLKLNTEGKSYTLSEGFSCILSPKFTHQYTFPKEKLNEHYYVFFGGYGVPQLLDDLHLNNHCVFFCDKHHSFSEKILTIYNNFKTNKFKYSTINSSLLLQILTNISISHNKISLQAQNTKILPAIQHMQNNYTEHLSIKEYADLCSMSESNFLKLFKKEKNTTPQKYIANVKLNIAKELLTTTNLSIVEISENIGFENPYHFSNFFKKSTTLSPLNYRKQKSIQIN